MEAPHFGVSLPVPCVQELAKKSINQVPQRYVRSDLSGAPFTSSCESALSTQFPVIDLARLASFDTKNSELEKLDLACKEWGFFHVINHGVSLSLVEDMKNRIVEFFELPLEEKNKYKQLPGELQGFGQLFVVSDDQKLDWGDMMYVVPFPKYMGSRLLEKLPREFRETVEGYSEAVRELAMKLLSIMADALKIDPRYMMDLFEEGRQDMRIGYYPPCPLPDLVMGLAPHSDIGALTILLQVNEVAGLQVKKDGKWILVNPIPDAFIVNIGDVLEVVTNGTYKSIEHRAIINSTKERLSLALFHSMKVDGIVGPAPFLVTPESPAIFGQISIVDLFKRFLGKKLSGKSLIDELRLPKEVTLSQ
ncbi:Oxoglutarate-dependent flavonoid 7-O-demethylase 1-like protein [Drosera capensis]